MKKSWYISLFMLLSIVWVSLSYKAPDTKDNTHGEPTKNDSIILVFAGDIMGHVPQIEAAYNKSTKTYDFNPCYTYIEPYIKSADIAVANLEVPLAGKPYSGYPCFSSPDALLDGAVNAGFKVMQLANNHIADRGERGIERSYITVNKKVKSMGVYPNQAQRDSLYPLIIEVKGLKIALLNCTFGTNGHVVSAPKIVNLIDTVQIRNDIQTARKRGAQFVVMTIHWGNEYELKSNSLQESLAGFMTKAGVDAIIGSHPHVVQNFEMLSRSDSSKIPVFYSLGNMISNQRWRNSNGGILARITILKNSCKIKKVDYLPFYVYKGTLNRKFQYYLIPTEKYRNGLLSVSLPARDDSMLVTFDQDTRNRLQNIQSFK
ncbi:CapA family protein [Paludibacter jiangxiensis]|uniref:Poly-gamma-glutamate synthesis protein n=1 Tax=Paludibacter jiangxiensis TaxID=681398 RepID=A0A161LWZ7_9BACT|nr:CapA family protein [Paludibacter jiangxiensis]GAT63872.1 poly-gamma-glutamate synthesis protein [Paludibacter jiangxiensis]